MKTSSTVLGFLHGIADMRIFGTSICATHCWRVFQAVSGTLPRSAFNFPINLIKHLKLVI